jgi:PilZ domain
MNTMQSGRAEPRMATNAAARLRAEDDPLMDEAVIFANISEHGARIITEHRWPEGKKVIVSDALVNFQTRGRVVYCKPHSLHHFAIGVKFN